jgi:flagellin-like hook-associated protein FlgL
MSSNKVFSTKFRVLILLMIFILAFAGCSRNEEEVDINQIVMPFASTDLKNENYQKIVKQLEDAGFINVDTLIIDDLIFGFFTEDGEVEAMTINGEEEFSKGEKFDKEVKITVSYHTFPEKESEEIVKETDKEVEEEEKDVEESIKSENEISTEAEEPESSTNTGNETEIITSENNDEFTAVLKVIDTNDPIIIAFAEKYSGRTIEFDGYIANVMKSENYDTLFDVLIYVGDSGVGFSGPSMQMRRVAAYKFPSIVEIDKNVRITAKVDKFREIQGLLMLDPIFIDGR